MSGPEVSAVVVSYEARDDLLRCLASLEAVRLPLEVVVVDNASRDGSVPAVAGQFAAARVLANAHNRGFAAACNQGAAAAQAPFLLFLNSDAVVGAGAVETMADRLRLRPEVGAVGPRTLNADGSVQVSFGPDLDLRSEWRQRRLVRRVRGREPAALREAARRAASEQEPDWISGSCMLVRREAFIAVRGFDEGFFLYEEDADFCRRLRRAGWRVLFTPAAEIVHHLGRSMARAPERASFEYQRSHLRYYRKHNGTLAVLILRALLLARAAPRSLGKASAHWRPVLRLALRGR